LGVGGYLTLRPRLADALRQLADRLGWSQGKVHKIEARRQGITPDDAEAWAIACDDRDRAPELHDLADRSLAETVAFRGALRERLPRQQREAQAIEASPLPNVEIRILPTSARVWWFQPVRLFEERTDDADALAGGGDPGGERHLLRPDGRRPLSAGLRTDLGGGDRRGGGDRHRQPAGGRAPG
jgi:hypothetical protein